MRTPYYSLPGENAIMSPRIERRIGKLINYWLLTEALIDETELFEVIWTLFTQVVHVIISMYWQQKATAPVVIL